MSRRLSDPLLQPAHPVKLTDPVHVAVRTMLDAEQPAVPLVDERGRLKGLFGERELIGAVFPGYLKELKYAGFIPRSLDDALEKQLTCRDDPVSKHAFLERVWLKEDFSDSQVAETFLHHRVSLIPVIDRDKRPTAVLLRRDFWRGLAEEFLTR